MVLPDVNVLVHAHRQDDRAHDLHREWLTQILAAPAAFAVTDIVLAGFIRVVTHPRIFAVPTPLARALDFASRIRRAPQAIVLTPGARHWLIFNDLCRAVDARGNLVPDAMLATLAIEHGAELITNDRDFARFPGLRWRALAGERP